VLTPDEVLADPDHADQVQRTADGQVVIRPELGAPGQLTPPGAVPGLGEHSQIAMDELAIDAAVVANARASGALR
jgi:hypothetical protein